ncbi:hypothetical protein, partial [Vibrio cholerae]
QISMHSCLGTSNTNNIALWDHGADTIFQTSSYFQHTHNARLRGWQRITPNAITTTVTTAAHWDWKRRALTVPLEAFVM